MKRFFLSLLLVGFAFSAQAGGIYGPSVDGVTGPASSTDTAVALFSGTTGKILQNSLILVDPATGNTTGFGTVSLGNTNYTSGTAPANGFFLQTANTIGISTNNVQRGKLDSNGNIVYGSTSTPTFSGAENLKFAGVAGNSSAGLGAMRFTNDAIGAHDHVAKNRSTSSATNTIVQSGDEYGSFIFDGANGTGFDAGASITANVDGTPGATADMPGRLAFWTTPDGSATPVERMRINSAGLTTVIGGFVSGGTKFTTTGCSVSATTGGANAGTYTSGTTGACAVVITINGATGATAPNGWACYASDRTTPADLITQTASTATTATLSGVTVSGDVISFGCIGY